MGHLIRSIKVRHVFTAGAADEWFLLGLGNLKVLGKELSNLDGRPSFIPLNLLDSDRGAANLLGQRFARQA